MIFFVLFFSYGYFHQGGGWNQNSRFAQVRSIVENHQLEINEYFRYQDRVSDSGPPQLVRVKDSENVDPQSPPPFVNTLDIAVFASKVYPNKPPGAVFIAVPAYWLICQIESLLKIDLDGWWAQTINAYLTTTLSVGLVTALAVLSSLLCLGDYFQHYLPGFTSQRHSSTDWER